MDRASNQVIRFERQLPTFEFGLNRTFLATGAGVLASTGEPTGSTWVGVLAFENGELMTQGDKLKSGVIPRAEERAEPREESREKRSHRNSLHD
jgi:hypothetical protein